MPRQNCGIYLFLILISITSCAYSAKENSPKTETISDNVYVNKYFNIRLPIPDGWNVASNDTEEYMIEVGEKMFAGDNELQKAQVEASLKQTHILLTLSKYEMGAPVHFNPNLILMAEKVSHFPGITSGADYLYHVEYGLINSKAPYKVTKSPYVINFGNQTWDRADFELHDPRMTVNQSYLSIKRDKYVISIVLSAVEQEQMSELEEIAYNLTNIQ